MASYEDDHNLRTPPAPSRRQSSPRRSRLNIHEFFQRLQSTSSSSASTPSVEHLLASYSSLAVTPILEHLITTLREDPNSVSGKGVPEGWTDSLERVDKKLLKPEDTCPICSNAFLDDKFPLVVRLPCHGKHIFDLECVAVWLKINATCPLDRTDLLKKKPEPPPPPPPEEKEEEWDDTYG